ncbi:MAG: YkvA family protein [Pseudomonadota bacterium]
MLDRLKDWVRVIKRDIGALWLAARDPRVPLHAKIVAGLVAAYALSPIDLIPDFIPVLGYLDDLILLPLGIVVAVKLVPRELMAELRAQSLNLGWRPSRAGLAIVVVTWLIAGGAIAVWLAYPSANI